MGCWPLWNISLFNSSPPGQNGRHLADYIFQCIFLNVCSWGHIHNIPASVQVMAWCRSGDNPLSEPVMVRLPMHLCVTQRVNGCNTILIVWYNSYDTITSLELTWWLLMPWCLSWHGGCWCRGAYLAPGHLQLSWWHGPVKSYQEYPNVMKGPSHWIFFHHTPDSIESNSDISPSPTDSLQQIFTQQYDIWICLNYDGKNCQPVNGH